MTREQIIAALNLTPLEPEGGYFAQAYRAPESIHFAFPGRSASRSIVTSIYYLITKTNFSRLHRLRSTEIYHFYGGAPVEIHLMNAGGEWKTVVLGNDLAAGHFLQFSIPPDVWQAVRMQGGDSDSWSLLGTVVVPGFEFEDFEIGVREDLTAKYPQHRQRIEDLTRAAT